MDILGKAIAEVLAGTIATESIRLSPDLTRLRSQLYAKGFVESERIDDMGYYHLKVRLPNRELDRVTQQGAIVEVTPKVVASQTNGSIAMEKIGAGH